MRSADDAGSSVEEWSLVGFDGRAETILMRLSLSESLDRAALVLPVRRGATVSLGREAAFARVSELTAPRVERRRRYHGFSPSDDGGDGVTAGAPRSGGSGVEVLRSQDLGPLRVVTLRSRSTRALETWLRDNRFPLADGLSSATQAYLDERWDIVVARLRPAAAGTALTSLQPLAIRFASDRPVYPLRLSRVDLFAPWKADVGGYGPVTEQTPESGAAVAPVALLFAGRVSDAAQDPAIRAVSGGGSFLTSYRFRTTPQSPDRDPAFTRAQDQAPYQQVRVEYDDVYLADTGGPVLVAAGVAAWGIRRRRRNAPR